MKVNDKLIKEIEDLYQQYESEVNQANSDGILKDNTVKTYLLHSGNFVRWCRGEFEPGGRNK
ncbi:hypothetical protein [Lacrimispora sp. 38-1]|uniref:hypothetical protein n=1 Tax=Lacrimispora sp. 38-1 TaxID=3125778 RepID=UPI003CF1FB04